MLLCLAASASATKILWVSDAVHQTPVNLTREAGFIDRLVAEGYTVERLAAPRTMDTAKRELANTYDLGIVSRWASGGEYIQSGERELWNSISAPMINMNAFLARGDRWRWLNSGDGTFNTSANMSVALTSDPVFAGVVLNENNRWVWCLRVQPVWPAQSAPATVRWSAIGRWSSLMSGMPAGMPAQCIIPAAIRRPGPSSGVFRW